MITKYFADFFRTLYIRNQVNFLAGICVMLTLNSTHALAQIQFEETTVMAGMIHKGMSYGASWGNVNADGWSDLWVSNHYTPPSLYINNGDGTFINIVPSLSGLDLRADAHGAAWGDFDNDGDQDLLQMAGAAGGLGSGPNQLLVNIDGAFQEMASDYGLAYPLGRGRMPLWLDWNRDGYLDVFMSNSRRADGQAPSALFTQEDNSFRNDNELVGLSFETNAWAQFADISGNGNWALILQGHPYPGRIYALDTIPFLDIRDTIGLESTSLVRDSVVADFNGDLLPDLYLSRSTINSEYAQTEPSTVKVFIKTNWDEQGIRFHATGELRFEIKPEGTVNPTEIFIGSEGGNPERHEFTLSTTDPTVFGIPEHEPGTNCCVFIGYDPAEQEWTILVGKDGSFELNLLVEAAAGISNIGAINFESQNGSLPNKLYIQSDGGFVDVTSEAGLGAPSGSGSVVAADFDNDMDIDLYVINRTNVVNQPNLLYENLGQGLFAAVSKAGVIAGSTEGKGNSVATADYDRDGFIDLFIANGEGGVPFNVGPHQLFRNLGGDNHWIEIDLEGIVSNRDGVGTYLLATAGGVTQLRQQSGGVHRFSQNHQRIHFGLGTATTVDKLEIIWPSGIKQTLTNVAIDQVITVSEQDISNAAPIVGGTAETRIIQGSRYIFTPTASDLDGNTLLFGITNKPAWANFSIKTGELSGTPGNSDVGITNNIVITANDQQGQPNSIANLSSFNLEVVNINDAPVVRTPIGSLAATQDTPFGPLDVSDNFSDVDGDTLSFSISGLPAESGISISTRGIISGTPSSVDALASPIIVTVTGTDPSSASASDIFTLSITSTDSSKSVPDDGVDGGAAEPVVTVKDSGKGGGGCTLNAFTRNDPTFPLLILASLMYLFLGQKIQETPMSPNNGWIDTQ